MLAAMALSRRIIGITPSIQLGTVADISQRHLLFRPDGQLA